MDEQKQDQMRGNPETRTTQELYPKYRHSSNKSPNTRNVHGLSQRRLEDAINYLPSSPDTLYVNQQVEPHLFDDGVVDSMKEIQHRLATLHNNTYKPEVLRNAQKFHKYNENDIETDEPPSANVQQLRQQLKGLSTEIVNLRGTIKPEQHLMHRNQETMSNRQHKSPPQPQSGVTLDDLSQIVGPMTDDAIRRLLHRRFNEGSYCTKVGPVLVAVNPFSHVLSAQTLNHQPPAHRFLTECVSSALRQLQHTGHSQAIVLSGECGSGKSTTAEILLRVLFDLAGGGSQTDSYKHISASLTVLRSLGYAATEANTESSRMGVFIESHISDSAMYRTKLHCYFIDQSRVFHPQPYEKNYHIFYQILAGLSPEEKVKFHLHPYVLSDLVYLNQGVLIQDEVQDAHRFQSWKRALSALGIPFSDVVRVLAAVLLLGNIQFLESDSTEVEVVGNNEIKSVAALLGVSGVSLYRGLTTKTQIMKSQVFRTTADAITATQTRDALAQTLYCRTVHAIIRRVNSFKRSGSQPGSSDLYENTHSATFSRESLPKMKSSQYPASHTLGIVDMFGFESYKVNHLEQLCINLCAETMEHFYSSHIFKSVLESYQDENIHCDVDVNYVDNSSTIELISAQYTGALSLLDSESLQAGNMELYLEKLHRQHSRHRRLIFSDSFPSFSIVHYAGDVLYDPINFVEANKDCIADDILHIFSKKSCNFGFVSHLFVLELKAIQERGGMPCGGEFRIMPTSGENNMMNGELNTTLSQDFHGKLDNLLKTLVHSRPHFIRCIKSNSTGQPDVFEHDVVQGQIRALQLSDTVRLMAGGYPHRMRYKAFNARYKFLLRDMYRKQADRPQDEAMLILQEFLRAMDESRLPYSSATWATGNKHIFLSESAQHQFERLQSEWVHKAATTIQSCWRRYMAVCRWPMLRAQLKTRLLYSNQSFHDDRRQAPYLPHKSENVAPVVNTSSARSMPHKSQSSQTPGNEAPPVPSRRSYTVSGNVKVGYPQNRTMKENFSDGKGLILVKGELIQVIGTSSKRGYLIVEKNDVSVHVPYQIMEIQSEEGMDF